MVNRLKGLIGLCECKGCKNRHVFELEAKCETLKGKKKKHKMRICKEHAAELLRNAKITNVMLEVGEDD
ncbi:MAG: hypothetical protein PHQ72_14730 [Hespellia sp.]|nr:hypothetical protein [Hespellia sp.]